MMAQGSVLWFCAVRGYGFIRPDGGNDSADGERELFVHAAAVEQAGLPGLVEGERVIYDMTLSEDGRPFATNLKVARTLEDKRIDPSRE